MTSTNDGKDVKSYPAIAQKGKTYYIEFYKSLEAGLSSDCDLRGRTKYLCEAWRRIHSLCQHSTSTTHPHLLSWLQRHTAKIILQTEWQSSTSKNEHVSLTEAINDFISESHDAIKVRDGTSTLWESELLQRAEWFKKTLFSPWGHATLKKLLDPQNGSPSDEEFVEWLKEERGIMVVTRLRQLAASKCDDLALSLATALMDRVRAGIEPHTDADQSDQLKAEKPKPVSPEPKFAEVLKSQAGFTADIWEFLVDIEFVLLHKCDKRSRCIELAKQTPLRTCYQLVERLENRLENSPKEKKLWKNAREVATLIAQVTIARCMVVGVCAGACHRALYWCARALARLVPGTRLVADTAALAAPAATSRHLHTLAVAVHAQSTASMKPFVCELYVRALTAGMNELERLKMKTEKETEARALEQTLSSWFTSLGLLLGGSARVQCECTLTAFSVHPSPFMYESIKKAPNLPPLHVDVQEKQEEFTSEFGSWANDSRAQTNLVKTSETLNLKHQKHQSNILSTAILTEGEALGLSPVLCQDIAVLLSGPRLKTLSWDMDRESLLDNCRNYMERTHCGTRALTTELKYLNLDPKEFQHLPEEDDEEENDIFYGIEKGYEHLVEFQPEEIWENATCSQEHSDSLCSSSLDSDVTVMKLKKKSRGFIVNSSEDSDPLSLIAEAKRKAKKKERPHSKERNKDSERKKTLKDPLDIQDHCDVLEKDKPQSNEKKKNKPGRKKKDKLLVSANPLSNLVGMKITKPGETGSDTLSANSIIDSDHESQGKFSLNSINSEISEDVVFDGLYSMDELKSPDFHTQTDKMELLKNNEFCVVNGVVSINKPSIATHSLNDNTNSERNCGNIILHTIENRNEEDCTSSLNVSSSLPKNINNVTEEVKKKITRLIEFRRHTKTKPRIPEQNDASSTSSNDSIYTNSSSGIKLPDEKLANNFLLLDTSSTMKSIEHNSLNSSLHTATPNCIKKQENIICSNYIHSDISNGMKRFDIKKLNNPINSHLSSNINNCENSFLNSLTHSDTLNGLKKSEFISSNQSLRADTSDGMKRPENKSSNYHIATEVPNCITGFENNFQTHVTPKVVTIPNIPKVFISKKPIKETGQLHVSNNNNNVTYPVKHFNEENDHETPATHLTMCNPFTNTIAELQVKNGCLNQNIPKETKMDMAQNHKPNELTSGQSPKPVQSYEIPKQNKFQSFLKELQKSINAGAVVNSNKSLATQTDTVLRVVKPVSRVTPVIPTMKKNDIKISQTIQQSLPERFNGHKSIDNSLNTFSRLSYMHKNRQNDSKLKQVVDALVELQNKNLRKCPSSKGLGQTIEEHKKVMTSYVHSKINANKAVTFSTPCNNVQSITTKSEKLNKPTIRNIEASVSSLKNNTTTGNNQFTCPNFKSECEIRKRQTETKLLSDKVDPITSSLTEEDQNDLLLLLRQKNHLNTCSDSKKMVITNTDQNTISMNQSCSSSHNITKNNIDKTTTSKISRNEQVDQSPSTNSSISRVSTKQKNQKNVEVNRPDKNLIISRTTSSIKAPRSLFKNSTCDQHKLKKTEMNNLSNDAHNKQLKGTTSTDWESVMNAILAQKTPSRGPNALDVALNKSSFAKAFADSIRNNSLHDNKIQDEQLKLTDKVIVSKSDLKQNIKPTKTSHSDKDRRHSTKGHKHTKRDTKHSSEAKVNKNKIARFPPSSTEMPNPNCNLEKSLQNSCIASNSNVLSKKASHFGTSKRFSNDIQKQFTCPLPQEDDPFISGIANSDYDLLEELMDDDLKQEIGELSSDEDNFNMSTHNALKKSVMGLEKHTQNIFNESSEDVTEKSNVSVLQKHQCELKIPVSILKPESRAGNICTTPVQLNQVYINNNPELKGVAENTKIYNKPLVRESTQANNLITNNKENNNKNKINVKITNEDIISTVVNSSLLMNTVVSQTFENMVLIEPGINYEQLSTSQTPLQNNVKPLHGSTYVDINKTSDNSLYQTTPFVPHVVENRDVDVITNRQLPLITPESLSALESEPSPQFDYTGMIKAAPNILSIDKNELCNTKLESNISTNDQLNYIFSKKNQTQLNLDIIKNNERKVLSEVQEKQNFLIEKKDQDDLKSTRVAIGNDFKKINDQDRLIMKRLCIINRKVHHYSSDKPIPLTYMPLKSSVPNSAKIQIQKDNKFYENSIECNKPQRLQALLNVKIQKLQNETKSKTSKENKSKKIQDVKSESHKSKKSRGNKSKTTGCRRKLIRSSNKNDNRSILIHTDLLNCDEKVNESNQKLGSFDTYELNLNNGKVPKRKITMKSFKGSLNASKDVNSNGDPLLVKKVTRKKRKKKEKLHNELEQLSTNLTHVDPIDIEDQILVSKIARNETAGLTLTLESNIPIENTEICLLNTNPNGQEIQTCDEVSKLDAQAKSDVAEIVDFNQIDGKKTNLKTTENINKTLVTEPTQLAYFCKTNEEEKSQDLIDLTLENKKPPKTYFIDANNLTQSDLQKEANLTYSQPQRKEPNIFKNSNVQNRICSSNSNDTSSIVQNLSDIPQSYKDSIQIIPLPPDPLNPLKKIVRIKLPNGRSFKATSYGKQDVDFNTLFSNPSLKSVLLDGLTDKTRYTLNIKQVATTTIDNSKKVVETRIQEIRLEAKTPPGPIETIDLLSDDEDSVTYQHFKTEFGNFKICSLKNDIFALHQKKFVQDCRVKLFLLNAERTCELNVCDILHSKLNSIENKVWPPQIEKKLSNIVKTTIQNDTDIKIIDDTDIKTNDVDIKINDTSNDTSNFITSNVLEETATLKESINKQSLPVTEVALNSKQSVDVTDQNILSINETANLDNVFLFSSVPEYENCYVKLINCDNMVEKYKKMERTNKECVEDLARCDNNLANQCTQIPSTNIATEDIGSLEKENRENKLKTNVSFTTMSFCSFENSIVGNINNTVIPLESGRSSPVINAFEEIASLNKNMYENVHTLVQMIPTYNCVAEWFTLKSQLSLGCKGPKFTSGNSINKWGSDSNKCLSEWHISKLNLSCQFKITKNDYIENINNCKLDFKSINTVPNLTIITKNNLELNYSKNLKRKLSVDGNSYYGRKMTKIETIRNIAVTDCGQEETYKPIRSAKSQNDIDNLETELFDYLKVCYESDPESDVASNNSESILAEHGNLFDTMIFNEQIALIGNDSKNELVDSKQPYEIYSKNHEDTEKSCVELVLRGTTGTPNSHILQSYLDEPVKTLKVDDFPKDIPKKTFEKEQNLAGRSALETHGIIINNEDKIELQSEIHQVNTNRNNDYNEQDTMYAYFDIKQVNETSIKVLQDRQLQENCFDNRDIASGILSNINSNKNVSSNSSTDTNVTSEVAPIILETTDGKSKFTVKSITEYDLKCQLPDALIENCVKHVVNNDVTKISESCLPNPHSGSQTVDNAIKNIFYSEDNKIKITKVSNNYSMEGPLKLNNGSKIQVPEVSEDFFNINETPTESTLTPNTQNKMNNDRPRINKGNLDHEYAAVYAIEKHVSEVEISNAVKETEEENCVIIDDDTLLTDDKYENITETIVDMNNDEILHEDYIKNELECNNIQLLSSKNIDEIDCGKVDIVHITQQEKNQDRLCTLKSYKNNLTVDVSNSVDSLKNIPAILKSVNIECLNNNNAPTDIISTNLNEKGMDPIECTKEIFGIYDDKSPKENLKFLIPKLTYTNKMITLNDKKNKKTLKRKVGMNDIKIIEKRYRKGKNIDNPFKQFSCADTLYAKEFARLYNYVSSVKFSYSQPFHKEDIDVFKMLTNWPIKGPYPKPMEHEIRIKDVLFVDLENTGLSKATDPLEQTLSEELNSEYNENKYIEHDIHENNFNMGFGEGSGRVIQNLEDGEDAKFSAATLSDVKQIQPFLLSEDYDECIQEKNGVTIPNEPKKDDQLNKIRHYLSYIHLKDKVQAFFKKTTKEFNSITERTLKSKQDQDFCDTTIFPFGLTHPDFIEPGPVEAIVHVVQVGQLPVSAAAQNPVTCDPRVTQVSDASPPQCSENTLNDDSQTPIKTEYTELTTADLSLPLLQDYATATHNQVTESHENLDLPISSENIPIETEIKSVVKIELMEELSEEKMDPNENSGHCESPATNREMLDNVDYTFDTNSMNATEATTPKDVYNSEEKDYDIAEEFVEQKQQANSAEKTDQIAHAMNAAGISTTETITNSTAHPLINILSENMHASVNNYTKTLPNTMSLQQALAQILPPVLNKNGETNQQGSSTSVTPQVLHIVQGKSTQGNQITLVDNSQQSVINAPNSTPVLHFVQNKGTPTNSNTNGNLQTNAFSGLSLVDTGLQQGGNQLLQIVNTGNQKSSNTSQLLKQVNLLTNLTNVQGSNEQKMVQFLCKSADGKSIQLNGPHPRGMVLRIQPVEPPNIQQAHAPKSLETQDLSPTTNLGNHTPNKEVTSQQEIKSRSVYEENYAKFIQNSSAKQVIPEKSTSLPKFNQAFGKQGYQDGEQKQNEINTTNSHLPSLNTSGESAECPPSENTLKLDHIGQMSSPPLLLRKSPVQTTQPQSNFVPQMKQTISPINIQSMHGSVIYRQIPVNLGGGQTINLITVPNTEVTDDANQKQQSDVKFMSQNEIDQSIIKILPQNQPAPNVEVQQQEENNQHININNENGSNPQQPVLTQMRIKLPMLSKTPQMVSGARVVRPSFFQIQRNVIGAKQQVYQQLVLTAAPPMGHQAAIRFPQTQNVRQLKVPNENPASSESQMSSSTLEQLREFDLVLEQVKERSTVQPNANTASPFSQLHATNDTTDSVIATNSVSAEPTQQVLYSIGNSQPLNMSYVSRKSTIPTPTTSTYVRSPDSSGIVDSPPSSSHIQIPHTITSDSTTNDTPVHHKPTKSSKPKPRPKASSNPPNTLKLNTVPPKTSTQKPLEDEQTTQRILYILAEYKEQVENSPDKDKPAPRRRTNLPPNPGSSKRKKSSSHSRRPGGRDLSPVHGDDTCRTMGSEDSSCGTSQGDCNDCLESHSPHDSPQKVVRKLSFEQETPVNVQRQIPQRNVIVADGQTITVARGASGKPTTAVLMPANYILPVSMVKGGQQIAIVTNRGPKLLTVTSGEGGTTNALLLQRLITPAGLKPVLARPGVRHVRLPAAALHSLQAFNLAPVTNIHPPDSTVSPAPAPTPPELVDTRANSSPWTERDSQEAKPDRGSSPEGSEPWNLPTHADPNDYSYEETVRTDNMDRTVLDPIPDRYSPDMEAQRIFDKMFDVDSKKSYMIDSHADSPRCGYDIDTSDCDDKAYHQIVHKKEGTLHRQHRLSHVSAAALRHKYAILEHELRLQKSLSEECEDLGVDSPSASELFPEAELLFAASPAHDNTQDHGQNSHSHTPQPTHSCISQPDLEDQIATDQLLPREQLTEQLGLEDVGIVTVSEDGLQTTIALDHEEFARSHPNTTFHSEPTDGTDMQPFTITGIKGRHITSTIFHSHRPSGTVLMTAPQTTVISQAIGEGTSVPSTVKYSDIENMIDALPSVHENNLPSVLVKEDGISRFDNILTDSRELHLSNTASAIVHSTGNATQVIRRVCCEGNKRDVTYLVDDSHPLIAGDDAKIMTEDTSRDGTMESMHGGVEEDRSSPERHTELFWESNSASERSESRRPLDFSSDSDKCCKSPFEETNSTDSGGVGSHLRLDSVIKEARGFDRSHGADCSSVDDTHHPPLRTYPPKRLYHSMDGELDRSLSGKTSVGDQEVRRRASGRGVVKRGCHCCNGSPAPPRPKKSRQKKLITTDFTTN